MEGSAAPDALANITPTYTCHLMARGTVYLETFGCQMNELDSELVSGQLRAMGYAFTSDASKAGVVLYNTCSVREHAEQKVWSRLGELRLRKAVEPGLVVGVLGCMAERDGEDLIRRMPVVDVMCGPGELDKLPSLVDNAVRTRQGLLADMPPVAVDEGADPDAEIPAHLDASLISARQVALQGNTSRRSATLAAAQDTLELLDLSRAISPVPGNGEGIVGDGAAPVRRSAYVRITRGCNKFCTYCVVPFTRGAEVHRPPDHIVDECKALADAGVIEVTLLGQTVNHYRFEHGSAVTVNGVTQPQKGRTYKGSHNRDAFAGEHVTTFADLLARIHEEVPGIQRLRFVTSYPRDFGDDVLEVMRDHPRLCRYLHVPAQSGSDRILKLMNRGYGVGEYLEFLDRARGFLHQPELGRPLMLSGDFIVGFPTETDEDFEATVVLIEKARYKNAFIFKYSPRPGTLAIDKLVDDVPEAVKRTRNNRLLAIQTRIASEIGQSLVGTTTSIFVEGFSARERKKRDVARAVPAGTVALTIAGRAPEGESASDDEASGACASGNGHVVCADDAHGATGSTSSTAIATGARGASVQLGGRTDGDVIVHFGAPPGIAPESLFGQIVTARITSARGVAVFGELA
jgi:tRNA-2-methylthio-N6-dimethylallyladenosine synthase